MVAGVSGKKYFLDDVNVLCPDRNGDCKAVHFYQNSPNENIHLSRYIFICKLHFHKDSF